MMTENYKQLPIIPIHDGDGRTTAYISIQDFGDDDLYCMSQTYKELKLYRGAVEQMIQKNYGCAEQLLQHLILHSNEFHYEYYERLATVYRQQGKAAEEFQVLTDAMIEMKTNGLSDNLIQRVHKRLESCRLLLD